MGQFKLKSHDGYEIFVTLWDKVSSPKAVIQICHGLGEYAGMYDDLAEYLNGCGYICFASDNRGCGRTETDKNRGRHHGNVFQKILKDQLFFRDWLIEKYSLPVFFYGHSYGSYIGQAFAQCDTDCRAIALSGSNYCNPAFILGAIATAPIALVAGNWRPKFIMNIFDKLYRYKDDTEPCAWLSRDPMWRKKHAEDPLSQTNMSVAYSYNMFKEVSKLYSKKSASMLSPATAMGLFSGDKDPLGGNGKGVLKLEKLYKSYGVPVETHLYPDGRHEMHGEINREEMWKDLSNFFDKYIIYSQTTIEDLI
ncbi:MAG: alpha/beta hydrolase [Clostridia bacterium]|nr:alpha/beta hydrolase [Clostridia bacterium]